MPGLDANQLDISDTAANRRPLTLVWLRRTLDFILEAHFIKQALLGGLSRPIRQYVVNDGETPPMADDLLLVTLDFEFVDHLRALRIAGHRNIGVLHMGDELGQDDRSFYSLADYVLRNYWFPEAMQGAGGGKVLWIPNGYRTGVGPIDPSRTLPFSERSIDAFFAGSVHEKMPGHERALMVQAVHQAGLPFALFGTPGFGRGFGASTYAAYMANSKFALAPGGKSPETIRLYDALEHGTIPICLKSEFIFSREALGAIGSPPLVLLDRWSSLATLYGELGAKPSAALEERRQELLGWWTRFKLHLQGMVRDLIESSFASSA